MKIRGTLTIGIMGIFLLGGELIQRFVIAPLVALFPSRRERILAWWIQRIADLVLGTVGLVGGARFGSRLQIPGEPGVLIVGNHQSLMDIPIAVASTRPLHPRFVTRARYARGKPLISHMVRLYQYPTVDPRATVKTDLETLGNTAAASPVPIMIYPEGTRTKDGDVGKLRRNGLRAILSARDWRVYVLSIDGYWQCAKLTNFLDSVSTIRGTSTLSGPLEFDGRGASEEEMEAFIDRIEAEMHGGLRRLRGEVAE